MKKNYSLIAGIILLTGCAGSFTQVSIGPEEKFPVSAGGVQVTGVSITEAKDLKVVQVHLANPGSTTTIWVKANWYDPQGVFVKDPKDTQQSVYLAGGEERTLIFTAPEPKAKFPRVQIRKGNR